MNCRVCDGSLIRLLTYENMPAMAQHLSDTPEQHTETLYVCQCERCGLVQLDNEPVWYWGESIRVPNKAMQKRTDKLMHGSDFVSLHVLEHQPYPNKYLDQFSGMGVIEVPNFDMILDKCLFSEIMLDHLLYFTEDTLRFALQYNGFDVIDISSEWDDFILSAIVERRRPLDLSPFVAMQARVKNALDRYISQYERVAIYGASHEAFAYIALLKPKVAFIVDDSPMKQGRYSPVGGLAIYDKRALKKADAVVIMGAGYSDEILKELDFDGGVAVMRSWGVERIK